MFATLRKMIPLRQTEATELMANANNHSVACDSAILARTQQAQLVEANKPKRVNGITPQADARSEMGLSRPQEMITQIQNTFGQDHIQLTVLRGHVAKRFGNARIVPCLVQNRPDFLTGFQTIADMDTVMPAEAKWAALRI